MGRKLPAGRDWKHVSSNARQRLGYLSAASDGLQEARLDDERTRTGILIVFGAAGCVG